MANHFTINITNKAGGTREFFLFQEPGEFWGGSRVFSNSLGFYRLPSYESSGALLTFQVNRQLYAGVQSASDSPRVGQASGHASAAQPIERAPGRAWTTASISPLGLSPAIAGQGVQPGAFRITTPAYQPHTRVNLGSAVEMNGEIVLSSFIEAQPNYNVDCRISDKFYIGIGGKTRGTVIDFNESSGRAALCDFNGGRTTATVVFNPDETWTVQVR